MNVSHKHPEARESEIFVRNMSEAHYLLFSDWSSRRRGRVAYDGDGNALNFSDWLPVFIEVWELEERHISISELRRNLLTKEQEAYGVTKSD
ncbi:MAG: hypothetical protein AAB691_02085 [Patescibacteria group bacterium]